ncbi:hypothetical protein FIV34_18005 [Luteibacter pinisoli]|uniref:Uncharacterized protein n=1 Tax=Luteibacter pinisoli TaxID=2589080 RepID=A0A4Y5Z8V9_9GAMM|nr:hypothetical protein [Luteibacter pinisoli]QDE40969.1 hypothetical protein FIV34_18005 [Luteibacter pinisoli]
MLRLPLLIGLLLAAPAIYAQSAEAPHVKTDDAWTYRVTTEKGEHFDRREVDSKVERVSHDTIYLDVQPTGATTPPVAELFGTDWSSTRQASGKPTVIERPFVFPLSEGKSWDVSYTAMNPNPMYSTETWSSHYVVVGWEDVEVPAGKFHALKIEAEGTWSGMTTGTSASTNSSIGTTGNGATTSTTVAAPPHPAEGRTYRAFWYVPSVKRAVKSLMEEYSSKGVRGYRQTTELESSKVS